VQVSGFGQLGASKQARGPSKAIGRERFEVMCRALEDLLDELDPSILANYRVPPPPAEDGP
jgi:hypothetical protein